MELYSLKFEIDFGVITDRGVFIEEILAEVSNNVYLAFVGPELNGSKLELPNPFGVWDLIRYETIPYGPYEAYMNQKEQLFLLQLSICQFHMITRPLCLTIFSIWIQNELKYSIVKVILLKICEISVCNQFADASKPERTVMNELTDFEYNSVDMPLESFHFKYFLHGTLFCQKLVKCIGANIISLIREEHWPRMGMKH